MKTDKSPFAKLSSHREHATIKRAAQIRARSIGGRAMLHYDSDATPCGCVLSTEQGAVPSTVVVARPYRNRTALHCFGCDAEWYEPEHPWRGLNPGPDGFRVIRGGV